MPQLLLALTVVVAVWLALRWLSRAQPRLIARAGMGFGLTLLVVLGLWLVLTGKLAGLVAVAAGLAPWIMRALRLHGLIKYLSRFLKGGRPSSGQASSVETRFLRMNLDHDSGRLDGEVLDGPFQGTRLSELSRDQAVELWRQVQADPDSVQVLEAWMDRTWGEWRQPASPPPPRSEAMEVDEAWSILGLQPGASLEEIKAAHRRLMQANHPDRGGSAWIAARINRARDLLMERAAQS